MEDVIAKLCSNDADGILRELERDEKTTLGLMDVKKRGGVRMNRKRLEQDMMVAKVIRFLNECKKEPDWRELPTADLQNLVERKTNELFRMRQVLEKRRGVVEKRHVDVDFTDYLTD